MSPHRPHRLSQAHPVAWASLPPEVSLGLKADALDWALANTLQLTQPSEHHEHLALVAAVSAAWRQGHACLTLHDPAWQAWASACPWAQGGAPDNPSHQEQAQARPLVWQAPHWYLRQAWQAEQDILMALRQRLNTRDLPPTQHMAELEALCWPATPTPQDQAQRAATRAALQQDFTLITGGPGTGKTHVVARMLIMRMALHAARHSPGHPALRVALAAPTGKAAARMVQALSQAASAFPADWAAQLPRQASTLHRLLLNASPNQPLTQDLVVVDEASMIDLKLMARLLSSLSPHTALVLLGDPDQLASVQAGAVLAQLCAAPEFASHRVHLQHSHRFQARPEIGQWASLTRTGSVEDLQKLWLQTPELGQDPSHPSAVQRCLDAMNQPVRVAQAFKDGWSDWLAWYQTWRTQPATPVGDDQALQGLQALSRFAVLCAVREGPRGVTAINRWVQEALDLPPPDATGWYLGRPVMVTQNLPHLGLMNGDIGLCLPQQVSEQIEWRVAFALARGPNSPVSWFSPTQVHPVETAWAMTVHKSQGSEFDQVLLALPETDTPVLSREWVYTAITRARHAVWWWASEATVLWQAVGRATLRQGGLLP